MHRAKVLGALVCVAAPMLLATSALAQVARTWAGGSGDWTLDTNWTPSGVPATVDPVTIDNGGTAQVTTSVTSSTVTLGTAAGDSGTITVTGASGLLTPSSTTVPASIIGNAGTGTLNILAGGGYVMGAGGITFGPLAGASGTLNIDGNNSRLTGNNQVVLGGGGTASATISNAGRINTASTLAINNATITAQTSGDITAATLIVGNTSGSNGTLNFTDFGSALTANTLIVGGSGTGTLNVSNRASVGLGTGQLIIGNSATGTGTVTVNDANTFLSSGSIIVGNNGPGTLTLTRGASVTGTTRIGVNAPGTVNVGIGFAPSSLNGSIQSGPVGGTLNINHNATLTLATSISGTNLTLNAVAGTTILTGNSTFTGLTTVSPGATLQLGNGGGGTASIITTDVVNNGTLIFNRSGSRTYAGIISGTGTVNKNGTGILILPAAHTYTGPTNINAGLLIVTGDQSAATGPVTIASGATVQIGNGGTTGVIASHIIDNGSLVFARSDTYQHAGAIDGAGVVTQSGPGTTILTGSNTWSGGMVITGGTLQVGNGGTTGSIQSDVANSGTLVFNRADSVTYNGAVSGTGTMTKAGTGTLILGGANSFTGGTTISSGTLQIGSGGTTGALAGPIVNNSSLIFARSNLYRQDGVISGTGSVTQADAGVTILTGANSYSGPTDLTAGTLMVDGNQSAATGLVTVAAAATLAGNGTIGGSVTVNGTLAPGQSPGTLTIAQDLTLDSGSHLAFELGQAGVVGGPLNDLIDVGGNVLLDGTLDVSVSAGGSIDPGLYRLINYGGTLNNQGLVFGTGVPADAVLQVSVPGQVNLVRVADPLVANFWDGAGGPNDGVISGGNDTWQAFGSSPVFGHDNWTTADGLVNAPFVAGTFAIFSAAAGTVTVDNSLGQVTASGMQFATDGYAITGQSLALVPTAGRTDTVIRVGDGTAAGAGYTATIDAALTGAVQVTKTDLGTLVLTGANGYTGGTSITAGVVQISSDTNLGAATGQLNIDGGTLRTTADITTARSTTLGTGNGTFEVASGTQLTHQGAISGNGGLTKAGAGVLVLEADNTFAGATTIVSGTLQLGSGGTAGSVAGDIVDNAHLVVDRSDDVTLAGLVSGSGDLEKRGGGVLTLLADDTYTGGTLISGGTLRLGGGGTTGSIAGDVVDNGTLAFDRSDLLSILGTISGSGSVVQQGTGTTVLHGNNSYTGTTEVIAGTLFVNGNQSAATGLASVASGATLGGTGTIGGDVTIADGATLSPGNASNAPGTLTINGGLTLGGGSVLSYDFGQANVVGGPLNDLTEVQGNLVLDGTLNVQATPGGTFDPGLYRVISYAGTLTNRGLAVGTIPSPDFFVQTALSNQVNLINFAGLELSFWDGDAGPKNDGVVNGGDGTWQNFNGNDNWTTEQGFPNGPSADASFAIFAATAGTVAVDNGFGSVNVSGIQFASDGYVIQGGAVTLVASSGFPNGAVIRVGDGTSVGAGFTTTIDSVLTGAPALVKTDLGTLVLTADNSYAGGTAINGGVVQIASDTNLGAAGTQLGLDSGTLRVTANVTTNRATTLGAAGGTFEVTAGAVFTHAATIGGAGSLTKAGAGTVLLTAANSYGGGTVISAGTLQLGDGGTSGSIVGNVVNNARLVFKRSDVVTIAGMISGTGTLTQAGTGTTILTGADTYTGGTTISAGTLQLGDGGTSGSIVGNVLDNGRLAFNRADFVSFAGAISGTGAVAQIGSGTIVLTSTNNSWSGPTMVAAGTLQAGAADTFSPNSQFTVAPGATFDLAGFDQTIAGLTNVGLVRIGGAPGTTLTVVGDYTGVNGTLVINTHLGDDSSVSDRLVIDGGRGDDTSVIVTNVGGGGAKTTGDGILVVDAINGATTTPTAFSLGAPVVAGPYEYSLFRGGLAGGSPDDWFLRSMIDCALAPTLPVCGGAPPPNLRPETSLYDAIPSLALQYGNAVLSTLDERMGGRRSLRETVPVAGATGPDLLAWGRIIGLTGSKDGSELGVLDDDGPSYDYNLFALQSGLDVYRAEHANGSFDNAGIYFAYGRTTADVTHFDGLDAGSDALNGWTVGGYWTHFGATGWYLDGVVQGTWYDITASGRLPDVDTNGFGFGTSLEGGYPFQLGGEVVLEPQAQLTYQTIDLDDTSDVGAQVRFDDVQSLVGRLGVRLSTRWDLDATGSGAGDRRQVLAWIRASVLNEFLGEPETQFSSEHGFIPFQTDISGASIKIDAGFDGDVVENISIYGNVAFQHQIDDDDHAFGGELGFKARF
jgi:fibronectin-binding autotransporter adhesin